MNKDCKIQNKPKNIKELIRSWYFWKPFLGIVLGALGGFLYYYFIGCQSGTCPITSSSWGSILLGSLLGLFITNSPCKSCSN
jgi:hypothetical protein